MLNPVSTSAAWQAQAMLALACILPGLAWPVMSNACQAAETASPKRPAIGQAAPSFDPLPATDGRRYGLAEFAQARVVIVVFLANHCPVAGAYESRLAAVDRDYRQRGVQIVAISCSRLEQDQLEPMRQRAAKAGFNFPYLHDASQAIGRAYGAKVTPEVFVLDRQRRLAYTGAIDDNWHDADAVKHAYLRGALDAILAGQKPDPAQTKAIGCQIDYETD